MKLKKLISVILAVTILLSSLALGFVARAKTNSEIALNTMYIDSVSGADDKIWYTFTPQASGNYAFVSYTQSNEAYLFTKTQNEDGSKYYNQIAYAPASDPDYMSNFREFTQNGKTYKHYATTFYLECYLRKGITYYFAAGYANESQTTGSVNVVLYNLDVDEDEIPIREISVDSPIVLSAYTDGKWDVNEKGENYYFYNISKVTQNMNITVTFKDGTVKHIKATDGSFDGYSITFKHNQNVNHWFAQNTSEYVANTLTVFVGPVSCDYDVKIETSAMYGIKGRVIDYVTNEPIRNASVSLNGIEVAKTDENGGYAFVYTAGTYNLTVKTPTSINYSYKLVVDTEDTQNNNQTENPIKLVNCDYVKDGIINAKDYAYSRKNGYAYYPSITNFTKNNY